MPDTDPPLKTFADLDRRGLEMRVACQKCGHQRVIESGALGDRPLAGNRFHCQEIMPDDKVCGGIGLPSIGKERRWSQRLAEHARQLRERQ
jgi:hypothetical protein